MRAPQAPGPVVHDRFLAIRMTASFTTAVGVIDPWANIEQDASEYSNSSMPFRWIEARFTFHNRKAALTRYCQEFYHRGTRPFHWSAPQQVRKCNLLRRNHR